MNSKRVVITGTGIISPIGNNVEDFWSALIGGECGIDKVTKFDTEGHRTHIAAEVKNFDIEKYLPKKEARKLDLFCQYAVAAADEAMAQSGLPTDLINSDIDQTRVGVLVSSGIGGLKTMEDQKVVEQTKGPRRITPFLIPQMIIDLASGNVSMRYGAQGPNMAIVTACSSATHSIGESMWMIKRGDADVMIAGGAEATICPLAFGGFGSMKATSSRNDDPKKASRPFDADRDGFVMGEGAGVVVLESLEHAEARGATILAEIVGYGASGDAYHITSPSPGGEGAGRAIKMAMKHADLEPKDIDYINAHGTSTGLNDKFETAAIKLALGEEAYNVNVSSTKGATGHALGAAGGFETIACIQALQTGVIPPTLNYETPDPECDLNYTPNKAVEKEIDIALNINLGFGGHNGVLALKRFK